MEGHGAVFLTAVSTSRSEKIEPYTDPTQSKALVSRGPQWYLLKAGGKGEWGGNQFCCSFCTGQQRVSRARDPIKVLRLLPGV